MSLRSTESSSSPPPSPKAQDSEEPHNERASDTRDSSPTLHEDENRGEDGGVAVAVAQSPVMTEDGERRSESPSVLADEEALPPLPHEAPPLPSGQDQDDGWDPVWDENAQAFYFYNRFSKLSQWENPRLPTVTEPAPPGVGNHDRIDQSTTSEPPPAVAAATSARPAGGYDPSIHGDYDPNADYAKAAAQPSPSSPNSHPDPSAPSSAPPGSTDASYAATGTFNRFTGKWQTTTLHPENFNDENKSKRQMNAYFDVDAAANSHDGKSLKAERSGKKLSKKEVKAFKEKRRERKEEKRRAWLRD